MSDRHPNSEIPTNHSPFERPLSYFSDRFNSAGPIKIVAIGSSSTAGEGGIAPYPCRLELALRNPYAWPEGADKFKNRMIDLSALRIGRSEVVSTHGGIASLFVYPTWRAHLRSTLNSSGLVEIN